jgi:4-amino-4-deoxy-L-arabinose transferase-like glycosyltransferase
MEIDAAQYASISREMLRSNQYLEIYDRGKDFLDKPPLLFWCSALSMKIFGITNWAYKLPALLFILLGIYSTYKFSLLYYTRQTATLAAFILSSTQAYFLITNDVRTDGILTSLVIFSIWQLTLFLDKNQFKYLFAGALGAAGAMMTKGPVGLILIGFALGGDLLIKRNWKHILSWKWILFLIIIAIILIPMCYGLYTQFDLHPEKEVYSLKGPSGIKFFFWTQSFGRITGDIYWNNNAGYFYFLQTILWDFQPWILFFIPALFIKIYALIKSRLKSDTYHEYITLSGFVLGFLALSESKFKLPHYIFPLFPLAAIITADFMVSMFYSANKYYKALVKFQFGLLYVFFIGIAASFIIFFPIHSITLPLIGILFLISYWIVFLKSNNINSAIISSTAIVTIFTGIVMGTYFYPNLLKYQSCSRVGQDITALNIPNDKFYRYIDQSHSTDFYSDRTVPDADSSSIANFSTGTYLFTTAEGLDLIRRNNFPYKIIKAYDEFRVSHLNLLFLYKETRPGELKKSYLLVKY